MVYMEKYLGNPRHIEIQVLADEHGNAVHLGERDCSMQRRHQKVIEEAPAPGLDQRAEQDRRALRRRVPPDRLSRRRHVRVPLRDGEFFFIEMNTRVQVEHPVTEAITGVDIVQEHHPHRRRRKALGKAEGRAVPRPRHRVPHQRRGPVHLRAVAGPHHPRTTPPAGRASASTRTSTRTTTCRRTTTR
jgi:hypothetical protein